MGHILSHMLLHKPCLTVHLLSCLWVKGPSGPAVLSDDEDAGHSSGLHGVQRWTRGVGTKPCNWPCNSDHFLNYCLMLQSFQFCIMPNANPLPHTFEMLLLIFILLPSNIFYLLSRLQLWTSGWVGARGGTKSSSETVQQPRHICLSTQH